MWGPKIMSGNTSSFSLFLMPFSGAEFFSFLLMDPFRHLVGLLGRGVQSSAKVSTYTGQHKHRET
jgi:hypothetical protein